MNEGVQWYVSGGSAADGIFTVNATHHDSQLAYDLRGMLGVRSCPPTEGDRRSSYYSCIDRGGGVVRGEFLAISRVMVGGHNELPRFAQV